MTINVQNLITRLLKTSQVYHIHQFTRLTTNHALNTTTKTLSNFHEIMSISLRSESESEGCRIESGFPLSAVPLMLSRCIDNNP